MSFTGEHRHSIDAKGRLIIPSRLREELRGNKLTFTVWPDNCISLWSSEGWEALSNKLLSQPTNDPTTRATVRMFFQNSATAETDGQGRVLVPQNLREFAGIDRDVLIIGAGDHAELWDPARYDDVHRSLQEEGLDAMFQRLQI